jgi:myosin heavy subunit
MDTQEILSKIAKLKKAVESESDADVKASYNKKIAALEAQVADAEAKVEKKEEKAAAQEKKTLGEADEKIKKLEKALASESDPDVKARYQKKLNELKGTLKDVKEEIKEEKKEIAEQKKEIKQAVKEVKSVQKEVRKTAIKKVAKKKVERKKVETKKTKRKEKLNRVLSDLDAMIEKNRKLKSKYGSGYKGTGKPSDLERDAGRKAKPFGYRFVGKHDYRVPTEMQIKRGLKRGTIDYEGRPNRADVNPDKKVKLAKGGMAKQGYDAREDERLSMEHGKMSKKDFVGSHEKREHSRRDDAGFETRMKKGGKVGSSKEDRARYAKPAGWRWKDEAVTKRVIERKQLSMQPSKKMRDKYPDLVYYEDRLNKADKKPTRTSADSI